MNSITVFLNLGMQGLGTKTFLNVNLNDTIQSFLLRVADQEGALGCDWIRKSNGKVITGTQFGHLKLSDFGFYNEMTLWGSLRLKGGAQLAQKMNANKVKTFGGSVVFGQCVLCHTSALNAKLPCSCIYCSSCMGLSIERDVNQQCASQLSCFMCKQEIEPMLAYEVAAYSDKQKAVADKQIFRNGLKKSDSMITECANCKQLIFVRGPDGNKQQCVSCKKFTCQICKFAWTNANANDKTFCGNSVCDPSIMYQAFLDNAKEKVIYGVKVTDTRFCPKCLKVNIHGENCKHITCTCKHEYCHICLANWSGHQDASCYAVAQQQITKQMLQKLAN